MGSFQQPSVLAEQIVVMLRLKGRKEWGLGQQLEPLSQPSEQK